jgi:hypothetical protein
LAYVKIDFRRVYQVIEHAADLEDKIVARIFDSAMPDGSDWFRYVGARIVKGFTLPGNRMCICYASVTDRTDAAGAAGLLETQCIVTNDDAHYRALLWQPGFAFNEVWQALADNPTHLTKVLDQIRNAPKTTRGVASSLFASLRSLRYRAMLRIPGRIVLRRPFANAEQWETVESEVQRILRAMEEFAPFTTMTLSPAGRHGVLAVPQSH